MIQSISIEEAYRLLHFDLNACLIDVREIFEIDNDIKLFMNNCHNIAWNSNSTETFVENINEQITDKKNILIFLCAKGIRSYKAAKLAENLGYQNCFSITNGIEANFYQKLSLGIL